MFIDPNFMHVYPIFIDPSNKSILNTVGMCTQDSFLDKQLKQAWMCMNVFGWFSLYKYRKMWMNGNK